MIQDPERGCLPVAVNAGRTRLREHFAGERIAESPVPLPADGFPELPAEALTVAPPPADPRHLLALLVLVFVALAIPVLAMRPRRLLIAAATLALVSSAATLSCHRNPDRTLAPDEHTRFHVADRLGSAALVLDHRGNVLTRDAADPYGASRLAWRIDEGHCGMKLPHASLILSAAWSKNGAKLGVQVSPNTL